MDDSGDGTKGGQEQAGQYLVTRLTQIEKLDYQRHNYEQHDQDSKGDAKVPDAYARTKDFVTIPQPHAKRYDGQKDNR